MRSIFAFILGVAFTIAATYVRDSQVAGSSKPLVNWTEVADSTRATIDYARVHWDRWTR